MGSRADRPDLAVAEQARQRQRAEQLAYRPCVVVRRAEEPRAPPVTGEQKRRRGSAGKPMEHVPQLLVGGAGVADLELQRLTDAWLSRDGDRPARRVDT